MKEFEFIFFNEAAKKKGEFLTLYKVEVRKFSCITKVQIDLKIVNNKSHIVIIYTIEKRPCKSLITQLTNTQRQGGKPI